MRRAWNKTFLNFIAIAFLTLVCRCEANCNEPPENCDVTIVGANNPTAGQTEVAFLLKEAVVRLSSNQTVVAGEDAEFKITLEICEVVAADPLRNGSISFLPYVRESGDNNFCQVTQNEGRPKCSPLPRDKYTLTYVCKFDKTTSQDHGTQLLLWIKSGLLLVCQTPNPLTLFVEEVPSPIDIQNEKVSHHGVSFTFSSVPFDVHIVCTVLSSDGAVVYHNTSCDSNTIVPPHKFFKHTGEFTVTAEPKRTVAKGKVTSKTFKLGKDIKINITHVHIHFMNEQFYAVILIEINKSHILSIPDYVNISSNCSDEYQYEKIHHEHINKNRLIYFHTISSNKRFCAFYVEHSDGKILSYQSDINTFHVQQFLIMNQTDSLIAVCGFLPYSNTNTCKVGIVDANNEFSTTVHIEKRNSSLVASTISPLPQNTYSVVAMDGVSDSENEAIAFKTVVIVSSSSLTSYIDPVVPSNPRNECKRSTFGVEKTVYKCAKSNADIQAGLTGGIVVVVFLFIVSVIVNIILVIYYCCRRKGHAKLVTPDAEAASSGDYYGAKSYQSSKTGGNHDAYALPAKPGHSHLVEPSGQVQNTNIDAYTSKQKLPSDNSPSGPHDQPMQEQSRTGESTRVYQQRKKSYEPTHHIQFDSKKPASELEILDGQGAMTKEGQFSLCEGVDAEKNSTSNKEAYVPQGNNYTSVSSSTDASVTDPLLRIGQVKS